MAEAAKMGRPTKRTKRVEEIILETVEVGMSRAEGARRAGVDPGSITHWCDEDPDFLNALRAREADGKYRQAKKLHDGGFFDEDGQWHPLTGAEVSGIKFHLATRSEDPWVEKKAVEHQGAITVADAAAATAMVASSIDDAMEGESP